MEVSWNATDRYFVKEKLPNGQTFFMQFDDYWERDYNKKIVYWNIVLNIYSKRKKAATNEELALITGRDPFLNAVTAMRAFELLESTVLEDFRNWTNIFIVSWVDNRRRDTYYKFLSKRGYNYGNFDGQKVIMKRVPPRGEEN